MKDTSAGFDGWTRAALRLLPVKAWHHRAMIENLAKEKGIFPDAYLHVPLPMLPKGQALTPSHHRGITIFSMLHRLVYGVVWKRVTEWQECWLDDAQQGGRRQGEYIADAWDLQAQIEKANLEGKPIVGALLDYEKFFDKFHPDLVRELLRESGSPKELLDNFTTYTVTSTDTSRSLERMGRPSLKQTESDKDAP